MKSLTNFLTEALRLELFDGRYQRLLTSKDVNKMYPKLSDKILPYLSQIIKPYTTYAELKTKQNELIVKRDENPDGWDKYQDQVLKLSREIEQYEAEYRNILKKAYKEKLKPEHFFIVEK